MAEYSLEAAPPLAGYEKSFGGITLTAPKNLAVVAIAVPLGGEAAAKKAIKAGYGVDLPAPGKSVEAKDKSTAIMGLAPDLAFAVFGRAEPDAEDVVTAKLGDAVYLTDQTDTWCGLEISGTGCRAALERICPIDLHPQAFAVNDVARTVMEHLGVVIARTEEDKFLLLSASSSARSFLHAVETSINNVS